MNFRCNRIVDSLQGLAMGLFCKDHYIMKFDCDKVI